MSPNSSFMDPTSPNFGWAILLATFLGPIVSVVISRILDRQREVRERRMHVFRALMSSRKGFNPNEFSGALNLIEIEFQRKPKVLDQYRLYLKHLGTFPASPDRTDEFSRERTSLQTKLISEISKVLGYRIQQLEILEGGYYPQSNVDLEGDLRVIRRMFKDIADGKRVLPIEVTKFPQQPKPPMGSE